MKKLFFLLGLLYFSIHGSTAAEKNIEALRKYVPGEPGNLKFQPRTSQPKASTPDLSTPDFSTMNMVQKFMVEKSGVELSFNFIER